MSENSQTTTCSQCGSSNLVFGIRMSMAAEVGAIGPQYKDGLLLVGTEPLHMDLCAACGHVQRFYVKNPDHRWLM